MYKVLIVEDELPAAESLQKMLLSNGKIEVIAIKDSIQSTVTYLQSSPDIDLIFMDIQLADGLSFNIFSKINIDKPIIFTTAYNQYALKAFKVNSIDYLLKPIDKEELDRAISKLDKINRQQLSPELLKTIETAIKGQNYKERFLIKSGNSLTFVKSDDIQYCYSDSGLTFAKNSSNKRHNLEETLDQLETILDPSSFFRINRKMILNINCIQDILPYFNNRIILKLTPNFDEPVIVSRQRVTNFKLWLNT